MNMITVCGMIREIEWGDETLLTVGEAGEAGSTTMADGFYREGKLGALSQFLDDKIKGRNVSVRYWITDQKVSLAEAEEQFLRKLHGFADVLYDPHYSEITGYLWTDEALRIGGHDLLAEVNSHIGKWLILEIDIHN